MSEPHNGGDGDGQRHEFASYDDELEPATAIGVSLFSTPTVPDYVALDRFGDLDILGRIARGGMAEVYLARKTEADGTKRHLVLKRILESYADDERFLHMFQEEGEIATRLYHPNVCHVYECGELDGTPYLTLEWVYGVSMRDMLRRAAKGAQVPLGVAIEIIANVADALQYIHHATGLDGKPLEIIHRDVSPHNVMVSWDGAVKLLDFGIAKTTSTEEEAGAMKGKIGYVCPEQLHSQPLDTRADIFALGICLWEAVAGKRLYNRNTLPETFTAIAQEPVPSLTAIRPEVPAELDVIVGRALAKHRSDRYQTAGELRDALRDLARAAGIAVLDLDIIAYLNTLYTPVERSPLGEGSGQLTGSFPTAKADDSWSIALGAPAPNEEEPPPRSALDAPPPPARRAAPDASQAAPRAPVPAPRGSGRLVSALIGVGLLGAAFAAAMWLIFLRG